jgi:hypothetical protein
MHNGLKIGATYIVDSAGGRPAVCLENQTMEFVGGKPSGRALFLLTDTGEYVSWGWTLKHADVIFEAHLDCYHGHYYGNNLRKAVTKELLAEVRHD